MGRFNLPDEVFAEIGKIVVLLNLLEASLDETTIAILGAGKLPRPMAVILTCELSLKQKVHILDSLLLLIVPKQTEILESFAKLRKGLFQAEQERNRIAHSAWGVPIGETEAVAVRIKHTAKTKRGLKSEFVEMSLSDLRKITKVLERVYIEAAKFESGFQEESSENGDN